MKTPFVAHAPSILVIHARDVVADACKAVAPSLGMPVRVVAGAGEAPEVVRATHPLVLVCDSAAGIADASMAAHLASTVAAVVVQLTGAETPGELTSKLRDACIQAERLRHS